METASLGSNEVRRIVECLKRLECPFCDKKSKTLSGLVRHIRSKHRTNKCPACGYEGNLTQHLAKKKDELHRTLYSVYGKSGHKSRKKCSSLSEVRKYIFGGD